MWFRRLSAEARLEIVRELHALAKERKECREVRRAIPLPIAREFHALNKGGGPAAR